MRRFVLSLLLTLPVFLLNSCLEGEEEIWVNLDGSGRLEARYQFPTIAMGQLGDPDKIIEGLKAVSAREKGVTLSLCTFTKDKSKGTFHLKAEFDDITELLEIASRNEQAFVEETEVDPDSIAAIAGDIDFRFKNLRASFEREITLSDLFPELVSKRPGMLGSSTFNYTLHLPVPVEETNAHSISEDRKTVSWSFLLRKSFDEPMLMSLKTENPIPWWAWPVAVLVLIAVFYLFWRILRRLVLNSRDRRSTQNVDLTAA